VEWPTHNKKAGCTAHILRRKCLLKHGIEGWIEGMKQGTERHGRRRRQLLDDLTETRGYRKLNEEALHRTMWTIALEETRLQNE